MEPELIEAIKEHQLDVPDEALDALGKYCRMVWSINRELNLTRHTDFNKFVGRDLIDSIELSKLIPAGVDVLDVGPGGGVPGIILAILRPDLNITLVESVGKKTLALNDIASGLELEIEIYHARAEVLLEDFRFDVTTARAVGPLVKMCTWFAELWPNVGRLLAVKGPKWPEEKQVAEEKKLLENVDLKVVAEYPTAGMEWKSYILELKAKLAPD